jgi:hypothetical protein
LVRLAGIEPTTPWFVAKYSIQLSYSREKQHYSIFALFPEGQNFLSPALKPSATFSEGHAIREETAL